MHFLLVAKIILSTHRNCGQLPVYLTSSFFSDLNYLHIFNRPGILENKLLVIQCCLNLSTHCVVSMYVNGKESTYVSQLFATGWFQYIVSFRVQRLLTKQWCGLRFTFLVIHIESTLTSILPLLFHPIIRILENGKIRWIFSSWRIFVDEFLHTD